MSNLAEILPLAGAFYLASCLGAYVLLLKRVPPARAVGLLTLAAALAGFALVMDGDWMRSALMVIAGIVEIAAGGLTLARLREADPERLIGQGETARHPVVMP